MRYLGCLMGIGDYFGRGVAWGLAQWCKRHGGYRAKLLNYQMRPNEMADTCAIITRFYNGEEAQVVFHLPVPAVVVSNVFGAESLPCVLMDDEEVGRKAAQHFLAKGFRHLAMWGQGQHRSSHLRWRGFAAVARAAGVEPLLYPNWFEAPLGEQIRLLPSPCGVLAFNDLAGRWLLEAAFATGRAVPDDIAILGVDNDELQGSLGPIDLSTVELPLHELGAQAAARAVALLESGWQRGDALPEPLLVAPGEIIERASTDTLAIADEAVAKAVQLARRQPEAAFDVEQLARAVGISRRALERRFQQALGHTVRDEIIRGRIQRACHLLSHSQRRVAEIAQASGFFDYRAFLREFAAATGQSPRHYRHAHPPPTAPLVERRWRDAPPGAA